MRGRGYDSRLYDLPVPVPWSAISKPQFTRKFKISFFLIVIYAREDGISSESGSERCLKSS